MLIKCLSVRYFCKKSKLPSEHIKASHKQMKYLNVAEKNDAAKTIAAHLSRGSAQRVC